jgi:hypothetical protein
MRVPALDVLFLPKVLILLHGALIEVYFQIHGAFFESPLNMIFFINFNERFLRKLAHSETYLKFEDKSLILKKFLIKFHEFLNRSC